MSVTLVWPVWPPVADEFCRHLAAYPGLLPVLPAAQAVGLAEGGQLAVEPATQLIVVHPLPATAEQIVTRATDVAAERACLGWVPGRLHREAYALDLRRYASWCQQNHLRLFQARRAGVECFARDLEARGRSRATITRRLCTIAGFYKCAVEEDLLEHSPAAHVRRPRLDYESHATALDRNELGALLVAAGLGQPAEHALISLLALNGLRVSEATGANIEALGVERGHRTLVITRKGGKGRHRPARATDGAGSRPGRRRA